MFELSNTQTATKFLDHVDNTWFNVVKEELSTIKDDAQEGKDQWTQLHACWQSLSNLTTKHDSINYLPDPSTSPSTGTATNVEQMTIRTSSDTYSLSFRLPSNLDKNNADLLANLIHLLLHPHLPLSSQNMRKETQEYWKELFNKLNTKHKELTAQDMIQHSMLFSDSSPSPKKIEIDTQSILKTLYTDNDNLFADWPVDALKQVAQFLIPRTSIKLSLNGNGDDSLSSSAHASIHAHFNAEEAAEAGKCCMLAYLDKFTHRKSKEEILSALAHLTIHSNNQAFIDSAQATLKQVLDRMQKPGKDKQEAIFEPKDLEKIIAKGVLVKPHSSFPKPIPTGSTPEASPGRQSIFEAFDSLKKPAPTPKPQANA